jgi:VanZ family protein
MPPGHRAERRLGRAAFAAAAVVSLVVLFAPAGDVPSAPPGVDKLVHAVLFLALAATGRWAGLRPGVLAPALVAYAAGSEVLQGWDAIGRTASVADWLADVAGVLAGLALWAVARRR